MPFRIDENQSDISSASQPVSKEWIKHAYPLQQITIQLQGTRRSDQADIINQLENVLTRIRKGDVFGEDHDDDYGYRFVVDQASQAPSFFDSPAGYK